jgi:GNAT superfamily N-acetyltransferase
MEPLKFQRSPLPYSSFHDIAIIYGLTFAIGDYGHWIAKVQTKSNFRSVDDIPASHLQRLTRDYSHMDLNPQIMMVCALHKGRVIGYSCWILPIRHSRTETWGQFIYRKVIGYKDAVEDWLFPSFRDEARVKMYREARAGYADKFIGEGKLFNETCYLMDLAVLPEFQRNGVGGQLLRWGLRQAQEKGYDVYLMASKLGFGFRTVGEFTLKDGEDEISETCMLWKPSL